MAKNKCNEPDFFIWKVVFIDCAREHMNDVLFCTMVAEAEKEHMIARAMKQLDITHQWEVVNSIKEKVWKNLTVFVKKKNWAASSTAGARLVKANGELIKQKNLMVEFKAEIEKRQYAADKLHCNIMVIRAVITSLLTESASDSWRVKQYRCEQLSQKNAQLRLLEDSYSKEMETITGLREQSLKAEISFQSALTDIEHILNEHKL